MIILTKNAIPNSNVTPNLGFMLLFNMDDKTHKIRADISCEGITTVVATVLGLNICKLQPLDGERCISFHILRVVVMVLNKQGIYVVHIPGVGIFFLAPFPNNLFYIEDG
jgi:hypothetical protein